MKLKHIVSKQELEARVASYAVRHSSDAVRQMQFVIQAISKNTLSGNIHKCIHTISIKIERVASNIVIRITVNNSKQKHSISVGWTQSLNETQPDLESRWRCFL